MKHWILFETRSHDKLALPVEDISHLDTYTKESCTTIYVGTIEYYVLDNVEDIVKRINEIVYGK